MKIRKRNIQILWPVEGKDWKCELRNKAEAGLRGGLRTHIPVATHTHRATK